MEQRQPANTPRAIREGDLAITRALGQGIGQTFGDAVGVAIGEELDRLDTRVHRAELVGLVVVALVVVNLALLLVVLARVG